MFFHSTKQDEKKPKPVLVTELVLRDAHQSLLATRMRVGDMLPICDALDNVGFHSLEVWGGATFDSCLRFLDEDPWERLRLLRKALPRTKLQMLLRGQNLLGYRHYGDDVVDRFVDKSIEYGMDIFRIFDALNDMRNVERAVSRVIAGGAHAQGSICYTVSPVHTLEMFIQNGRDLESMGCQSIVIKDMAALMCPVPAYELVRALKSAVKVPIHVHTHSTTGVAPMVLMRAIDAGADGVDTAISSLSGGAGHVCTEALVESFAGTERDTGLRQADLIPIAEYVRQIRPKYEQYESGFKGSDPRIFISQIPGGMLSNLESQLKQMGCFEKMDQVLKEVPRVREEMGFIPLVTPTSQIVGTQAVFNVLLGERYKNVPVESRNIFAGRYGRTPAPVSKEIQRKVLGEEKPITCRPADEIPHEWETLEHEVKGKARNDDDVLSYAVFPKVWLEFYEKNLKPKAPLSAALPPVAVVAPPEIPVVAPAPKSDGHAHRHLKLAMNINGTRVEAMVEVLEP